MSTITFTAYTDHSDPGIVTPPSGKGTLYFFSDNEYYVKLPDGTHVSVTGSGMGGGTDAGALQLDGSNSMTGPMHLGNQNIVDVAEEHMIYRDDGTKNGILSVTAGELHFSSDDQGDYIIAPILRFFCSVNQSAQGYDPSNQNEIAQGSTETLAFNLGTDTVLKNVGGLPDSGNRFKAPVDAIYNLRVDLAVYAAGSSSGGSATICCDLNLYNSDDSLAYLIGHRFDKSFGAFSVEENWVFNAEVFMTANQYIKVEFTNDCGADLGVVLRFASFRPSIVAAP